MIELLKKYGKQKTTWIGLLKVAAAIGLVSFAPELQEQLANNAVLVVEGLLAGIGIFLIVKDEDKEPNA